MSTVKVYYSKQASATDAFALLAEGYNELVQDGHTPERLGASPVGWSNEVYYADARRERDCRRDCLGAGAAARRTGGDAGLCRAVEPPPRHLQGAVRSACDHAKKRGVRKIIHQIGVENATARTVMLATKALLTSQTFEHDIE